jgi:hypothetical protein
MSKDKLLPIDPKDLMPAAVGFVIGLGILLAFYLMSKAMGQPIFVDHSLLPRQ